MGSRLAYRCIRHGKAVSLFDPSPQALQSALAANRVWLQEPVESRDLSRDAADAALDRLRLCSTLDECVRDADIVIEVVPERLDLKREVFAQIDRAAPGHAILATGSSAIPCSRLADATRRPDKVVNIHFYQSRYEQPPEIMGGPLTSGDTLAAAEAFVRSVGTFPILLKREILGFGMNTIWHEIKKTALRLVAGSFMGFEDIDRSWILGFGQPRGLFAQMDYIGLDTAVSVEIQYCLESSDVRDKPPQFLERLVAEACLGVKSGRGFYTYPNPEFERPGWLRKEPPWTPEMAIRLDLD